MKYAYFAVFSPEPDNKNAINVSFPDVPGCHTCGDGLADAIKMAEDALCLTLYDMEQDGKPIPAASAPRDIQAEGESFVTAISVDTDFYKRFYESKAVKKTLTIPGWLNKAAEDAHINFSKTLQRALKQELNLAE